MPAPDTPSAPDDRRLDAVFAALADPTRRAILARLAEGEATVGALAAPFRISLPAVSRHLKVLERAGLIARAREGQWRVCRLEPGPLRAAAHWVAQYRAFWEARFDALDDFLTRAEEAEDARDDPEDGPKRTENAPKRTRAEPKDDGPAGERD